MAEETLLSLWLAGALARVGCSPAEGAGPGAGPRDGWTRGPGDAVMTASEGRMSGWETLTGRKASLDNTQEVPTD